MGDFTTNIALGLHTALSLYNLLFCAMGITIGTILGLIPGIGVLVSISLLAPITFHLDPTAAMIMLAGIYYGTNYGGSIASILLNVPGTPANAVACLDGYPMAQQGRGGPALFLTAAASFCGASVGVLLMMLFAPVIAQVALNFASWEYFSLMVLGLVAASALAAGSALKGIAMVVFGVTLGMIGIDLTTGVTRFTFGSLELYDGLNLVALAMGLFGVAEVIGNLHGQPSPKVVGVRLRDLLPTRRDIRDSAAPVVRGTALGSILGALPGAGGLIASFMSYAMERRVSKSPARFGKGAVEGLTGPEASNSAADMTAFIPTMTLGIPGNVTMALMLGVLIVHGITPGPNLISQEPELFWGLVMSFWVGNILLVILNIPMIGLWVRVLAVPQWMLYPAILVFVCIGVYSINQSVSDIFVVLGAGMLGFLLNLGGYSPASLMLGFVLGPMMEQHFRRAQLLADGDVTQFFQRPISGGILALAAALLLWSFYQAWRTRYAAKVD